MGFFDHIAAAIKSSFEEAEMIGWTRSLIWQMEDELTLLRDTNPEKFATMTREQFVLFVQSMILDRGPRLTDERRLQCLKEAREIFGRVKGVKH